jgi:MFS superfamily sulfate permease-like transporter
LFAQGTGNIVSGLLGGLPVTAVIVRTSANLLAGAVSSYSTIIHGVLLAISIVLFPLILNSIPLSALSAILLIVGFKLTNPNLYISIYKKGFSQFLPFIITIAAILLTNMLVGIGIGLAVGLIFVLISNFHRAISVTEDGNNVLVRLRNNVTFLNKTLLRDTLMKVKTGRNVFIDGTKASFIDSDIIETIEIYCLSAKSRGIQVELKKSVTSHNEFFRLNELKDETI